MKILYVGSLDPQCNSFRRFKTLGLLGNETIGIDIEKYINVKYFIHFHYHLNIGPGIVSLNRKVVKTALSWSPDILLVDNKSYLTSFTLRKIRSSSPGIKIVNLITDDPIAHKNAWRIALNTVKYYDIIFVQRAVNIKEFQDYGAKKVALCYRSFDPEFHRKIHLSEVDKVKYQNKIGFIGNYEKEREEYIAYLIQNNIPVKVVGGGWQKGKYWNLIRPYFGGPPLYGEDYIKFINGMDISLHFLRHENRDEQDSRTFEIPACGAFMLAENSDLHKDLFCENEEIVLFSNKEELLEKVLFYSINPVERKRIAENGHQRCLTSGYDHQSRMEYVLAKALID